MARKEGRLLTKKQKEEKQMAEIRKQALLASGVQIEGLQQTSGPSKKVVYGNRKKKAGPGKDASPAPESRPRSPEPALAPTPPRVSTPAPAEVSAPAKDEPEEGDWDASSDEEPKAPPPAEVKDDWDASSEDEAPGR